MSALTCHVVWCALCTWLALWKGALTWRPVTQALFENKRARFVRCGHLWSSGVVLSGLLMLCCDSACSPAYGQPEHFRLEHNNTLKGDVPAVSSSRPQQQQQGQRAGGDGRPPGRTRHLSVVVGGQTPRPPACGREECGAGATRHVQSAGCHQLVVCSCWCAYAG
jgi:hypothetical protein